MIDENGDEHIPPEPIPHVVPAAPAPVAAVRPHVRRVKPKKRAAKKKVAKKARRKVAKKARRKVAKTKAAKKR
jgi:hypothetical protein